MNKLIDVSNEELHKIGLAMVQQKIDKVTNRALAIVLSEIVYDMVINHAHNDVRVENGFAKIELDRDTVVFNLPEGQFSELITEKVLDLARFE